MLHYAMLPCFVHTAGPAWAAPEVFPPAAPPRQAPLHAQDHIFSNAVNFTYHTKPCKDGEAWAG